MVTVKKILCIVLMLVCVLGIILAVVVIGGSWVANQMAVNQIGSFLLKAGGALAALDAGLGQVEGGLGAISGLVDQIGQIPLVGELVKGLAGSVGDLTGQASGLHAQVNDLQSTVATLQQNLRTWVNTATLIINVFFLWFALAQVSVFFHALGWFSKLSAPSAASLPAQTSAAPSAPSTAPATQIPPAAKPDDFIE